jgi:hypothetical protein
VIVDALAVLGANCCFLLAGAGLTRSLGVWSTRRELPRTLALAYLAGVAAIGLVWTLLLLAGAPLRPWSVILSCLACAAIGFRPLKRSPLLGRPPAPVSRTARWLALGIAALIAAYLVSFVAVHWTEPITSLDGWAKWTLKARSIVLLDGVDPRVFAGEPYRGLMHDYPLFFPSLQAIDFRFIGWPNTEVLFLQPWLLLAGFVGALAQCLRGRVSPLVLWPSLLLLAVTPALAEQVRSVLADAPLAFFVAFAALAGWFYVADGDRRWLALLALFAGAAIATKEEGTPYALGVVLLVGLSAWRARRPLLPLVAAGGAIVLTALPWRIWTASHQVAPPLQLGVDLDPGHLATRAGRVLPALRSMLAHSFDPRLLLVALPLACATALLLLGRRKERALPSFVLALLVIVYVPQLWAYWASPADLDWLLQTSVSRVTTIPGVLAGVFLPLLLQRAATVEPAYAGDLWATRIRVTRPAAPPPRRYALARDALSHARRRMR